MAADEEATLIHQLEMLEIEEEIMEEEDEVAIVEVPKSNDVPQATPQPEKKRIQSQITAFFAKNPRHCTRFRVRASAQAGWTRAREVVRGQTR